jgi:hypothetical protein
MFNGRLSKGMGRRRRMGSMTSKTSPPSPSSTPPEEYIYTAHTHLLEKEKRMARSFFGPPVVYICQHRKLPAHFFLFPLLLLF